MKTRKTLAIAQALAALLLWGVVWALAGCKTDGVTPVAPTSAATVAPIGNAVAEVERKVNQGDQLRAKRDSALVSSLEVIGRQNDGAPASPQQIVIAAEQAFSMRLIGNITPTAEDRAAAAERETLLASGRADEARRLYAQAASQAADLNAAIARAQGERDAALRQAAAAVETARVQLDAQQKRHADEMRALTAAHERDLADERKKASDAMMAKQARDLNLAGAGCLLAFGLFVGFGGIAGLTRGWPFGLLAVLCFGLAQIVSQWWFKWAALGVAVAAAGAVGWWVWRHLKDNTLRTAANEKAAQFKQALGDVVPALDHAYDEADASVRDLLDRTVFARLSALMDKATKATIHEVRADAAAATKGAP